MSANIGDLFTQATNGTRPQPTSLTSSRNIGDTSVSVSSLTGWPTATAVHFCIYSVDVTGKKISGSQTDWKGIASGTTISDLVLKAGTDVGDAIGAIVEAGPTAAWANDMVAGLTAQHTQAGHHLALTNTGGMTNAGGLTNTGGLTTDTLTVSSSLTLPDNSISAANLASTAITLGYAQIVAGFATSSSTPVQATGLSVTVTIPSGGRHIKITAYTAYLSSPNNAFIQMSVWDGTVGSGTQIGNATAYSGGGNTEGSSATAMSVITPTAGSKTYNVGLNLSSGTASIAATATTPAFILVEAI